MKEKNGDLKYKTDNAIDEAYRRGFTDGAMQGGADRHKQREKMLEALISEYQRGYEDKAKEIRDGEYTFYEKGLNDAWECAKKAWSMSETEFHKIFNTEWDFEYMLDNLSATEVVQKIKEWQPKHTDDEINVGDEVYDKYNPYPRVVTLINEQDMADLIDARGNAHSDSVFCLKKTGRHFPQIAEVLERMRKESE